MNGTYPIQQVTCATCGVQGQRQLRKRTKPEWFCSTACRNWQPVLSDMSLYLQTLGVCGSFVTPTEICTSAHGIAAHPQVATAA